MRLVRQVLAADQPRRPTAAKRRTTAGGEEWDYEVAAVLLKLGPRHGRSAESEKAKERTDTLWVGIRSILRKDSTTFC